MGNPLFRYPLDPTGLSPDNKVENEIHVLNNRANRTIVPLYGSFFANSVVLIDNVTKLPLTRNTQWYPAILNEVPTCKYGKDIFSLIVVTDTTISNEVILSYQVIGAEYADNEQAILDAVATLNIDKRPISWPNVLAKPSEFPPALHLHDAGDVYGFEYLVHALDRIRVAIEFGDLYNHEMIYKYIDSKLALAFTDMKSYIDLLITSGINTILGDINDFSEDELYFFKDQYTQFTTDYDLLFIAQERM